MELITPCPRCQTLVTLSLDGAVPPPQHCDDALLPFATDAFLERRKLNQCPACGAAHLYRQKDFNRKLGLLLVGVGIAGAYWTYGLSLLGVTILDWWLYRQVGEVGCCYQCPAQFRGEEIAQLDTFDLELQDYYKNRLPDAMEKD